VVVVDLQGEDSQLVPQLVRTVGTGDYWGDKEGNRDWGVAVVYQPLRPNLAFVRVRRRIQDLLDLGLDLSLGVAKIFLELEDFLGLR
jgi:hypothetical protein